MTTLIPEDIELFLVELGTFHGGALEVLEVCAKAAAALLWEKYVLLGDPSIQVSPKLRVSHH